jgi:hypothetical protein
VFIWVWDVVAMGGRHLNNTVLDAIAQTRPVVVWDASEDFLYANTGAMKKAGITDDPLMVNGVMAGRDGKPTGSSSASPHCRSSPCANCRHTWRRTSRSPAVRVGTRRPAPAVEVH